MNQFHVEFRDGRTMIAEPGVTFDSGMMKYVCFTDHRTTGPFFAKRHYVYYFKINQMTEEIVLSDNADKDELNLVSEALGEALDCPTKGLMCLFELVKGGVKRVSF